jgi:hypothetical protein
VRCTSGRADISIGSSVDLLVKVNVTYSNIDNVQRSLRHRYICGYIIGTTSWLSSLLLHPIPRS